MMTFEDFEGQFEKREWENGEPMAPQSNGERFDLG